MLVMLMTERCCCVRFRACYCLAQGSLRSKICSRSVLDDNCLKGGRLTMCVCGLCFSCTTQVCSCCLLLEVTTGSLLCVRCEVADAGPCASVELASSCELGPSVFSCWMLRNRVAKQKTKDACLVSGGTWQCAAVVWGLPVYLVGIVLPFLG
jgi:hypothetical protein